MKRHALLARLLLAASPSIIVGQRDSIVSDSLLSLTVDLSLHGVSLEVALNLLAEGSGLTIEISTDVAGDTGAVSCACMGVTVRQALGIRKCEVHRSGAILATERSTVVAEDN